MTDLAPILALVMAAISIIISLLPRRRHVPRPPEHRQLYWDSRAACAEIDASVRRGPQRRRIERRLAARPDKSRQAR
ncbi:MAG TPA: hypothetical protein VFS52_03530 [Steroidobacteraceae bacterium]|jgi:hypothetical protein|nr:hypothetical protein [Steroidobacteraceae bacterium]